jgi:hypothetical protein
MADEKISALTSAGALSGTETLPIVQGGVTKKTTVQDVADLKATPDLQQVTTAGATTSVGITVDNGAGESVGIKHDQIKIVNALGAEAVIVSPTLATTTNFEIPNKLGGTETFAMLSDITAGGDVFLANDQTFTGENTFDIPSGNDTPVTITKGGNNAGLKVTKSSGSGDAIEVAEGSVSIADETASTIAHFDADKRLKSLATSTYPSLTELALVKGVTGSDIQTQINALKIEEVNLQDIGTALPASTYTIVLDAKYARTINELTVDAGAGTCTLTMNINGTPVTGISSVSVSTTEATYTATAANAIAIGDIVTIVTTSNSGLENLQITVKTTR